LEIFFSDKVDDLPFRVMLETTAQLPNAAKTPASMR
jgi:hypothetical protein